LRWCDAVMVYNVIVLSLIKRLGWLLSTICCAAIMALIAIRNRLHK
jgi:hypothetical protein